MYNFKDTKKIRQDNKSHSAGSLNGCGSNEERFSQDRHDSLTFLSLCSVRRNCALFHIGLIGL